MPSSLYSCGISSLTEVNLTNISELAAYYGAGAPIESTSHANSII